MAPVACRSWSASGAVALPASNVVGRRYEARLCGRRRALPDGYDDPGLIDGRGSPPPPRRPPPFVSPRLIDLVCVSNRRFARSSMRRDKEESEV